MASRSFTIQTGIGPRGPQGPPGDGGGGSWDTITGGAANHVPMDIAPTSIPTTEGTVSWNADDHTLNVATDISGVVLQVGQEQHVRIRNVSGSTIANGSVVYLSGSSGQRPTVDLADADNDTHVASTIGLATADVTNNSFGFVTTGGLVRGVNTAGMTEGAPIYLSTTAGAMTQTAPTSNIVRVGFCIVAGNNGTVLVHVEKMSMDTFNELTVNGAATFNDSIDFTDGTIVGMTASAKLDWRTVLSVENVDNTSDATKNAAVATLTNKTIDVANNTLTGVARSGANTDITSITSSTDLTLAAGGTNQNVVLTPSGTGIVSTGATISILKSGTAGFNIKNSSATFTNCVAVGGAGNMNIYGNWDSITNAQSDTSKPSLSFRANINSDTFQFIRVAAGAGATETIPFSVLGNGTVLIGTTTDPSLGKLHVAGGISATGALTLGTALSVANGGTGSTTAAGARTNLAVPASDPTGIAGAAALTNIVSLTQAQYDALGSKSSTTLYVIT